MDCRTDITDKHVLFVEDIIDTGLTLKYLFELFNKRKPASLECTAFLQKRDCLKTDIVSKWIGFQIEPVFVIGYGLDFAEQYRTLPYIAELKEDAYSS